ncbi:hypothetical protein [Pengzhenrongella sicca]|uniref:Uncharacterized protein n=1 Tax=Pengzhenrongella sicca TaxID=2819238 RepID=A0A8A4ZDD1_9MICO|nr:hypothetical protein [Pengzhenrongella sicca]QTE29962.1 hypothetical protein J4E96_02745 [Pengzhenrongella sicca]
MLGGIALAAILIGGLTVALAAAYPGQLTVGLCRLSAAAGFGSGDCSAEPVAAAAAKTDADYQPGVCMLNETSETYNAEVKIWFVKISEGSGFIVQEFSDGSVRATLTDGATVGATASIGSKTFDSDKLGTGDAGGVDVSLGADLEFEYGDTWEFDDAAQWDDMKDDLDSYLLQQVQLKNDSSGGVSFWLAISNGFVDPPKDPKVSYGKIGIEAALEASVGVQLNAGIDTDGKKTYLDPELGANLTAAAGSSVVVETNHETGEHSYTYALTGKGSVGADGVFVHGSADGEINGAFTTVYGKDGKIAELSFKSSYEVGTTLEVGNGALEVTGSTDTKDSQTVATTTTITVDDDNRALVNDWLSFQSGAAATMSLPFAAMVPSAPSSDPFLQLLYEDAKTSEITYHNVKDGWEFGVAVKKGWEFGFNVSAEEATATKTDANFLGAPGVDGVRPQVNDTECD